MSAFEKMLAAAGPYAFVFPQGADPLWLQKRGIASTVLQAEWRQEEATDNRLPRILCPVIGRKTPSVYFDDALHLTSIGWRRVRAHVKIALERAISRGDVPATLFSFADYEQSLLPLLELADRRTRGLGYEEDIGIEFPYLLLLPGDALVRNGLPLRRHQVTAVNHQGGGHCCSQSTFHGIVLRPNERALALAKALDGEFYESSCTPPPHWNILLRYQAILKAHDVTCLNDYAEFQESVYPLDATHARSLAADPLPKDLSSLVDWREYDRQWRKSLNAGGRRASRGVWRPPVWWRLLLVTSNSD